MRMAYIYALCDPNTGDVRYIGKSIRIKMRPREHLREKGKTRKCRWLATLIEPPIVKILETVPVAEWEDAERRQIRIHRELGCDLTNHTDGGDGRTAFLPSEIEALSEQLKKRMADPFFRQKIFTPQRSERISVALTGKPKSSEHVAKLPQNNKGFKQSANAVEKKRVAATGKKQSEAWIAMMAELNKGNQWGVGNKSRTGLSNSLEMNAKISAYQKDRPKTVEQRRKMSLARAEWWRKRKEKGG